MPEHQESHDISDEHQEHWKYIRSVSAPVWVIWSVCLFAAFAGFVAHYYVDENSVKIRFFADALFSFAALAIIVTQAVIYSQQRDVMKEQQEMLAISQRAYVGIEDGRLVRPLAVGESPHLRMKFRNGGSTPAWAFRSHYRLVVTDQPLQEAQSEFPVQFQRQTEGAFIPAGQIKRVEMPFDFKLDPLQLAAVMIQAMKLFIFIEVEFRDFRGNWQHDSYRIVYNPDNGELQEADEQDNPN